MGRHYLSHMGGFRLFCCVHCETFLTNRGELISTRFTGATGRAFLFNKVVNLNYRYEIKNISISFGYMLSRIMLLKLLLDWNGLSIDTLNLSCPSMSVNNWASMMSLQLVDILLVAIFKGPSPPQMKSGNLYESVLFLARGRSEWCWLGGTGWETFSVRNVTTK